MADIQHYERILKKTRGAAIPKLLMILLYAAILGGWVALAFAVALNVAIIFLAPLSLLAVILLTWKYTSVEYEYSFVAGTFTFSKIYGKKKIRTVFECDLKMLVSAKPYDSSKTISEDGKVISAIPDTSPNPCLCLFEDGDSNKYFVVMDCDEMTARILKFFKMSAVDRQLLRQVESLHKEV